MIKQPTMPQVARPVGKATFPFGFWAAVLTAVVASISFAIAVQTPPASGPFCQGGCLTYPYEDAAAFVPRDYIWMYPATLMMCLFLVLMSCIHSYAAEDRKLYSQIGLVFAVISSTVLAMDYYIQLAMVQPSLLKGELEGLVLISQYNPHGIFIALEELGYLMMSLAFLFMGFVFAGESMLERSIGWLLIVSSVLALAAYVVMSLLYGKDLEYRFEIAVITIDWIVLMVASVLLSFLFKRVAKG
jgi:hypothetical protein